MGSQEDNEGFAPPPAFSIEEAPAPDGVLLLVLAGEVDLATSGVFRQQIEDARRDGSRAVVLDMADVTFVDSTMLRELLRAHNDLKADGGRLVLAAVQPAVLRLFQLTGTAEVFALTEGRDEALGRAQ